MYEKGVITIGNWQNGISSSALLGHASIVNCDIHDTEGVLKIATKVTSELTPTGLLLGKVQGQDGSFYTLYDDGKLYKGTTLLGTYSGAQDIIAWKNYIWFTWGSGTGLLGCYGPLNAPGMFSTFQSGLTANYWKKLLVGSQGNLYIGNGNYVGRINGSTFVEGTYLVAPTATYTGTALTLPSGVSVVTLENIGKYLAIGTQRGLTYSDRVYYRHAHIYLWDFTSLTANLPIQIQENGMQTMISTGNTLYFIAGTKGNIYISDTTQYKKIKSIPFSTRKAYANALVYPNAMAFSDYGNLLIGTSGTDAQTYYKHGVWEVDVHQKSYPIVLKYTTNNGKDGSTEILTIGCVWAGSNDSVTIGWKSGTSYSVDSSSTTPFTGFMAYAESPLITVGTSTNDKGFKTAEYRLTDPLVAGQQIKIYWRENLSATWNLMGTFDTTNTNSGEVSHNFRAGVDNVVTVQFKIMLSAGSSAIFGNNIGFISLTVY